MEDFEYGSIYTLEDEEGNIEEFELVGHLEYNDAEYLAMVPFHEKAEDILTDDGEFVVLKKEMEDDEEVLVTIDDDDEFDAVSALFMDQLANLYEDENEEIADILDVLENGEEIKEDIELEDEEKED